MKHLFTIFIYVIGFALIYHELGFDMVLALFLILWAFRMEGKNGNRS